MATSLKTLISPSFNHSLAPLGGGRGAPLARENNLLLLRLQRRETNGPELPRRRSFPAGNHPPPPHENRRQQRDGLSVGHALHTNPIKFCGGSDEKASFDTTVKFIIKPIAGGKIPPADGLIFFVAPVNSTADAPGVFDGSGINFSVFAVKFDVYVNTFDPSYRHVGIDIQSQISSNITAVDDGIVGREVAARIRYTATTDLISVRGSAGGKAFEVSVYELCQFLPREVRVDVAAATGNDIAVHDIILLSFSSSLVGKKHI